MTVETGMDDATAGARPSPGDAVAANEQAPAQLELRVRITGDRTPLQ